MRREHFEIEAPDLPHPGALLRFGHAGRPVLAFPTELGRAWEWEDEGMVGAIAPLIEEGQVMLFCVDTYDAFTWSDRGSAAEERARRYRAYESWLVHHVVPRVHEHAPADLIAVGASLGAYHALQLAITRADIAPRVLALSGSYDPSLWHAWGEHGEHLHWTNPSRYLDSFDADHLEWLRSRLFVQLVVGQGEWETWPTGALPGTRQIAAKLAEVGIPHDLDVWGHDVAHHWHWWRLQLAHQLPALLNR
ncbi:alpha/beta hydrolase-fold protein [Pseudactinotalea terrae]|uniref:alpha/beta hydrolase-fold protein n=1 Tax=Pseudactinotalea terrae TaxID=1743262 RepID=UPI0012E3202A|nr:alpha/beta hydrolase-fold protein [Pseudactinotalea terrae]